MRQQLQRVLNASLVATSGIAWGMLADKYLKDPSATWAGGMLGTVVGIHFVRAINVHPVACAIGTFTVSIMTIKTN